MAALWTVCANVTVWLHGSFYQLLISYGTASLVLAGVVLVYNASPSFPPISRPNSWSPRPLKPFRQPPVRLPHESEYLCAPLPLEICLLPFLGAALMMIIDATVWQWLILEEVLLFGAGFLLARRELLRAPHLASPSRWGSRAIWGVAVLCAVLALVIHRSDYDDSYYIHMAVAAADSPSDALLARDTLLGIRGLPLAVPIYRVHSYELLNAAFSLLAGIPAIQVFHWIAAAVAAFMIPLAYALLFRELTPKNWYLGVVVLLLVLLLVGGPHRWFSNFALVRIFQGKAIFLNVFLPLLYVHAIRFVNSPSLGRWTLLLLTQIASMGMTSTAVWCAPLSAAFAALVAAPIHPRSFFRLALVPLSSTYVLIVAVVARLQMKSLFLGSEGPHLRADLHDAAAVVWGTGTLSAFCFAILCLCWALVRGPLARRFALLMPLLWSTLLFNPLLARTVVSNVTGPSYWRVFWAIPLPAIIVLAVTSPLDWRFVSRRGRRAAVAAALMLVLFVVPESSVLSRDNRVSIGWPRLKVPYAWVWARRIHQEVEPGAEVLAPDSVGLWLPTFHHSAYPQMVRHYLRPYIDLIGRNEFRRRRDATRYVAGLAPDTAAAQQAFAKTLNRKKVQAVVLEYDGVTQVARKLLAQHGFTRRASLYGRELWLRVPHGQRRGPIDTLDLPSSLSPKDSEPSAESQSDPRPNRE